MEEVDLEVEFRLKLLGAKPVILAYRLDSCPRCAQTLEDTEIDYLIEDRGRLLMNRGLPAIRCAGDRHLFILEETFDKLEHLIASGKENKVKPATTLTIPVYGFS